MIKIIKGLKGSRKDRSNDKTKEGISSTSRETYLRKGVENQKPIERGVIIGERVARVARVARAARTAREAREAREARKRDAIILGSNSIGKAEGLRYTKEGVKPVQPSVTGENAKGFSAFIPPKDLASLIYRIRFLIFWAVIVCALLFSPVVVSIIESIASKR